MCKDTKNLKVFEIGTKAEVDTFKDYINAINPDNPFYKPELFKEAGNIDGKIHYFVYFENNRPSILMCFYLRPIKVNDKLTQYQDTTSPYGYSGPLFQPDIEEEKLKCFWKMVDAWYQDNNVVSEFVRFSLNGNHIGYTGKPFATLNNVKGELLSKEKQWDNFKPKVRNNYRKAQKEGLDFTMHYRDISQETVSEFYDIYIKTMQRNNAVDYYYFPKSYFSEYLENNPKNAAIAMVLYNGKPISTEFVLLSENTIFSYLGGTLSDFFHTRPNDFLKINVMDWGRDNGKKYYVLGGGRKNEDQLYKYKKNFFPIEEDIVYYTGRKIVMPKIYQELIDQSLDQIEEIPAIDEGYFPAYRSPIGI